MTVAEAALSSARRKALQAQHEQGGAVWIIHRFTITKNGQRRLFWIGCETDGVDVTYFSDVDDWNFKDARAEVAATIQEVL